MFPIYTNFGFFIIIQLSIQIHNFVFWKSTWYQGVGFWLRFSSNLFCLFQQVAIKVFLFYYIFFADQVNYSVVFMIVWATGLCSVASNIFLRFIPIIRQASMAKRIFFLSLSLLLLTAYDEYFQWAIFFFGGVGMFGIILCWFFQHVFEDWADFSIISIQLRPTFWADPFKHKGSNWLFIWTTKFELGGNFSKKKQNIRCKLILIWHFIQFDEKCWKSRFPSFMGLKYLGNLF